MKFCENDSVKDKIHACKGTGLVRPTGTPEQHQGWNQKIKFNVYSYCLKDIIEISN